jgi:hypothetical protein
MPRLRSGLSNGSDGEKNWQSEASRIMRTVSKTAIGLSEEGKKAFRDLGETVAQGLSDCSPSAPMRQIEGLHEGRISGSS